MPQNNMEDAPLAVCNDSITRLEDSLNEIIPDNANKPYDMAEVIRAIVDNGEYLESAPGYAKNIPPRVISELGNGLVYLISSNAFK